VNSDDRTEAGDVVVDNGARRLTLNELARTQPGMGRLMPEVGARAWKLYHAGQARNWPMARYQLEEMVSLLELSAFVRPKYQRAMGQFLEDRVGPLKRACDDRDADAFEAAFAGMVESANAYHVQFNKGFIRWRVPEAPPPDLDLTPLD
jgi:hypothetical protein